MLKPQFTINELTARLFPVYFYRRHLDIAARDILGLKLSPHHRLILRDWGQDKPYNILLASRGMGKSVLLAIYYLLMSILYPKLKMIAIGGAGYRQSKMLLLEVEKIILNGLSGQIESYYAKNSLLDAKRIIFRDPSYWSINFKNGSTIFGIPLGVSSDGSSIRGLRAHIIGQDEAFLVPTRIYQTVVEPFSNVLYDPSKSQDEQPFKNMELMTSTIDFSFRDFYKQYEFYKAILEEGRVGTAEFGEIKPAEISLFEFNIDDTYYIENQKKKFVWGIKYDNIIKKKQLPTTDINFWLSENKNIPVNLAGSYFPWDAIENCQNVLLDTVEEQYPEVLLQCTGKCILGIDTAPASANTAFVVVKVGAIDDEPCEYVNCKTANFGRPCPMLQGKECKLQGRNSVVYAYEENKMSQTDRIKLIYKLMKRYNLISIAMDARGGGYEVQSLLRDREFLTKFVGEDILPIIDPSTDIMEKAYPILKMYATTQDINMDFAAKLKGLITNTQLLFPKQLRYRPESDELLEVYGHCETLVGQLARIKAVQSGRFLRFEIDTIDPESGRTVSGNKDLFSALLYAVGRFSELLDEKIKALEQPIEILPLPVSFRF